VKPDIDEEPKEKKITTKRKGGLKTATEIRAEAEAVAAERKAALEAEAARQASNGDGTVAAQGQGQGQTVHRDSSGRIVDIEKLKREAKEKEDEDKRKAREREEWSKGMVQRQGRETRAREEKEMGGRDVARCVSKLRKQNSLWACYTRSGLMYRYADDVHINREMKEVERWNDPASEFLTVRPFLSLSSLPSLLPLSPLLPSSLKDGDGL